MDVNPGSQLTLQEAVALYSRDIVIRPRTLKTYRCVYAAVGRYGIKRLDELTRERVGDYLRSKEEAGNGKETRNRHLVAILSLANHFERLGKFPLECVKQLRRLRACRLPTPVPRFLTRDEYGRLLAAAKATRPLLGLAVALTVHTGLRMTELRTLHHEDLVLDAADPFVRVRCTGVRMTKTGVERTAAMLRSFATELRALGVGPPRTGPIFEAGGGKKNARRSSQPYVYHRALENWMKHARRAAELGDDVTFITLRHTYASWLVQGGVSIAKVAGWLGNQIGIAWKHYVGLQNGGDPDIERGFQNVPMLANAVAPPVPDVTRNTLAQQLLALAATTSDAALLDAARIVLGKKSDEPPSAPQPVARPKPRPTAPWLAAARR